MSAIELMKNEHEYIKRMLSVVRNMCMEFIDNNKIGRASCRERV